MNKKNHPITVNPLAHKLKQLPNLPGIYKMLDKQGQILYIGKAKSLKNRVSSYFIQTHNHPKTQALVERIADFELIITRGETEALLLEQNLIKEHRPPYNILLRDDKSYLYIYLSADKFPRLAMGRGKSNHVSKKIFGPYPATNHAKELITLLQKMFQIRTCSNTEFANRKRPCLEYQIKRCSAPCVGLIDETSYQLDIDNAVNLLSGNTQAIKEALITKMQTAADTLQFELAASYRDRLIMLNDLQAKQAVYTTQGDGNADVMAIAIQAGIVCVHVLTVRLGQVLGGKNYFLDDIIFDEINHAEHLVRFIFSFYREISDDLPNEIITSHAICNKDTIATIIQQTHPHSQDNTQPKITIKHQVRTHKKAWLDIATINANNALQSKLSDYHELQERFYALKKVLTTVSNKTINRIECFDISHTMGEAVIGACVVFDTGGARRREYRQYAIYDVCAGDDYAAMRQVLTRRYQKHALPDMLLIDGGKGQLNIAKSVLDELHKSEETLLVGVAKGEGRKAGLEILHFIHHQPIDLPADSKALHLIMHIRDEAHRFAISNHRKKRDKARGVSVLEIIPGLGKKRRRDLLTHFGGIQELLSASQEEIANVKGIGTILAKTIYQALHN